ncbi:MAG: hypothetical protein KDK36_12770, partial [Leptospiraceae bacterium]|nr:hypothetical protein [Leptospiraceae bacterium]
KTYGYQIILDELWEGLSHSYLFIKFNFEDPRTIYKYISSLCGGILFFTFLINFQKIFKQNLFTFPLLLGNAGILLFYGYFENYTITTLYIFLNSFVVYWIIYNNKKGIKPLLILAALAAIGCIFHLVFAYTFFSLVYLAFILSDKKDFIKNSIFSAILAGLILGITFGYFLFFSDLRIDPAQGHATNPKFYPIRKWISIGHFKEIFSCMFFNSASSLYAIFYFYFFEKTFFKEFFKSRFGKFLLFLLLGFLLHGFVHDPQLGFPADWDLMGFYWIPLSLISIFMIRDFDFRKSFFLFPFFIFNFILIQFTSFELNKPLPKKEKEVKELLSQINNFNNKYSDKKEIILPEHRKFHVRTLFFLYRTHEKLKQNSPESKELLETNEILEKEFISRYPNYDKIWKKDFLTRATKYHEDYLEFIKNK